MGDDRDRRHQSTVHPWFRHRLKRFRQIPDVLILFDFDLSSSGLLAVIQRQTRLSRSSTPSATFTENLSSAVELLISYDVCPFSLPPMMASPRRFDNRRQHAVHQRYFRLLRSVMFGDRRAIQRVEVANFGVRCDGASCRPSLTSRLRSFRRTRYSMA